MVGVIDLGSNSFISLVVDGKEDVLEEVRVTKLSSRFREGVLEGCGDFRKIFLEMLEPVLKLTRNVKAFGTAVFREAHNGMECLEEIASGVPHEILSEESEARYSFLSVVEDEELEVEDPVVFDLGGGSLEIVTSEGSTSLPLGTWKIIERYDLSRPSDVIRDIADGLKVEPGRPVGIGGTFVTIASFKIGRWDLKRVHGLRIDKGDVERLLDLITDLDPGEIENLEFVPKGRGETLLAGSLVTLAIIEATGESLVVSRRGYRYGVAWEMEGSIGRSL